MLEDRSYSYDRYSHAYENNRVILYSYDLSYKRSEILMPYDIYYGNLQVEGDLSEYEWVREGMIMSIVDSAYNYLDDDNYGWQLMKKKEFHYSGMQTVPVKTQIAISGVEVYPNPAVNTLRIFIDDPNIEKMDFKVYDLRGKVVLTRGNYQGNSLDVSNLTPGMYLIEMQADNTRFIRKFVKSAY
jgi:hypothetical protein